MEEAKSIHTLILDTNVLISSFVRSEGITRASLTILLHDERYEIIAPADVVEELRAHAQEICRKAGITQRLLEELWIDCWRTLSLLHFFLSERASGSVTICPR